MPVGGLALHQQKNMRAHFVTGLEKRMRSRGVSVQRKAANTQINAYKTRGKIVNGEFISATSLMSPAYETYRSNLDRAASPGANSTRQSS